MRYTTHWKDYQLLDTSSGERLEQWGEVVLVRPDPQIIWNTDRENPLWSTPHARYFRSSKGGGEWKNYRKFPQQWTVSLGQLTFKVSPTNFKHTGLFPEQAVNWEYLDKKIRSAGRPVSVLNLFAYTGGATMACAAAGASVCHVDASKGMVAWAKENAALSGLTDKPIRYIVDDCKKFVEREIRRGTRYDVIIMDPPSYGRGPSGEIWKLEDAIYDLLETCVQVLSDQPLCFLLNSYTTGLSASVMACLLEITIRKKYAGAVHADEIGLPAGSGICLPCGSTAIWEAKE